MKYYQIKGILVKLLNKKVHICLPIPHSLGYQGHLKNRVS